MMKIAFIILLVFTTSCGELGIKESVKDLLINITDADLTCEGLIAEELADCERKKESGRSIKN